MGIVIEKTAVSTDSSIRSSIAHAARAANDCLSGAKVAPHEVDLLMNVGVYRDSNMVEPAMAALIQKETGINLDYTKDQVPNPAASFDLMNGACGVLNAIQVGGAFLAIGSARRVAIVSSDAHPSNSPSDVAGFPFVTLGAAMLLRKSDGEEGFGPVKTRTVHEDFLGMEGYVEADRTRRDHVTVKAHPEYEPRALALATALATDYMRAEKVDPATTYLISSQLSPTFAAKLGEALGFAKDAVELPNGIGGDPHSSALTYGYHHAIESGLHPRFRSILFVAAGAGLTSACAVYRL